MAPRATTLPLLLTYLSSITPSVSETPVTCTAPLAVLARPADVTCYFQSDVNASRKQIVVIRHAFGAPYDDLGKDVLTCIWPAQAEKPLCKTKEGYSFDGDISDRLTLQIESASNETEGEYACHVVPPDGTAVYRCSLTMQVKKELPPVNIEVDSRKVGESTQNTETGSQPGKPTTVVIVLGLLVVALAISTVILGFRLYRHRCRVSKNPSIKLDDPEADSPLVTEAVEKCPVSEDPEKFTQESSTQTWPDQGKYQREGDKLDTCQHRDPIPMSGSALLPKRV